MSRHLKRLGIGVIAAALMSATATTQAQVSELMRFDTVEHRVSSGLRHGDDAPLWNQAGEKNLRLAHSTTVHRAGMNMMRVHFGAFDLGTHSEIHLISLDDGAVQRFNHDMLVEWNGWSAIFNGDLVEVQLHVAPHEDAFFEIAALAINDPVLDAPPAPEGFTLCGSDSRVASTDSRVGRLSGPNCGDGGGCGGCTAWLTSLGCALTAGHCGAAANGLIEFNVPASSSSGAPNAADPTYQYPVGAAFHAFQDQGQGNDWAIMSVGPNADTGLRAHWVQGYFHLSPATPSDFVTLRVTGYGVDNSPFGTLPGLCCATNSDGDCTHSGCNAQSLTLQTSTGPKKFHSNAEVGYEVDTEPANSGSPVMRNSNQFAIAIHTHGGCTSGGGDNTGTLLTHPTLRDWLGNFLDGAVFVDFADITFLPTGTPLHPAQTVPQGVSFATPGDTVAIAGGNYTAANGNTGVISNAVTLQAVSGNVVIGN